MKKFKLTEDHIKLLRHMRVGWGYSETGAPEIDPKRPYGNSDVDGDIHKILTGEYIPEDTDVNYDKLHRQTETALQIVLRVGKFEPGVYVCDTYGSNWRLESEPFRNFVDEWYPIETAPKTPDATGVTPMILLGFSPDEEGYSLPTSEGFWNISLNKWLISIDPHWGGHGQPTHWRSLPSPPSNDSTTPN
jgi:hypothetical protein